MMIAIVKGFNAKKYDFFDIPTFDPFSIDVVTIMIARKSDVGDHMPVNRTNSTSVKMGIQDPHGKRLKLLHLHD